MNHSAATEQLFDQVIADTPPEIKREVEWCSVNFFYTNINEMDNVSIPIPI